MMSTDQMRKEIHEYLNHAEERLLKAVHALLKEYSKTNADYRLTESEINLLEERRAEYKTGKSKTYTPQQIRKMIHAKQLKKTF